MAQNRPKSLISTLQKGGTRVLAIFAKIAKNRPYELDHNFGENTKFDPFLRGAISGGPDPKMSYFEVFGVSLWICDSLTRVVVRC